ncbi:MAG: restriction endonuclease subunit S [Faecalimonas sp.]
MSDKKNVPKIRFPGFTEPWEQRKLGEICSRVQGNDGRMELPTLTISAANGWMKQEDRFSGNIAGKEQKNYTLLHKGELSYNHGNSKLAKYGTVFSLQTYEEALVPRVYHSFKVESGSADFIEYYFSTKMPNRELRKLISSGARMDGLLNIGYDDFMGIKMMFPSTLEQDKIAEYFRALDHLITLHQRKLEHVKKMKKSMLQKMFPKKNQLYPEVRFPGFTDAWEQRKLEDIYGSIGNAFVGTATPYYVESGHFYLESNNIKDGQINHNTEVFINDEFYEKQKDKWLHTGDMVMVQSGHVGHAAVIPEELNNSAAHALIMFRNPKKEIEPYFLNYQYQTLKSKKKIENITTGNTIKHILASEMQQFEVDMPELAEQKKIAEYFRALDHLITLHQRELDHLQLLKKGMLQQMFI